MKHRFLSRIFMTVFYGFSLAHCMGMLWLWVARISGASAFAPTLAQMALPQASRYLQAVYWGSFCGSRVFVSVCVCVCVCVG